MNKTVVVDSDAIFAIYNPNDPLNTRAIQTFRQLIIKGYQFVYPTSVLFEVISLFQRVLPTPTVIAKLVKLIKSDHLLIHVIDINTIKKSAALFDPAGSNKNTLIDCSVAIVAKEIKANGVFSFDRFYAKQGLLLAQDLISDQTQVISPTEKSKEDINA